MALSSVPYRVEFDKAQQANLEDDHNWYEYNWYRRENLLRLERIAIGARVEIVEEHYIGLTGVVDERNEQQRMLHVTYDIPQEDKGAWYAEGSVKLI